MDERIKAQLLEEMRANRTAERERRLKEAEAEITAETESLHSILFQYMLQDRLDMVEALISDLPDVNFVDEDKDTTLLELAVSTGASHSLPFINMFLDRGADINLQTGYSSSPLDVACGRGEIQVIKLLLKRGADINAKDFCGETVLMKAVERAKLEVIKLLLDEGADVNARNELGESALDRNEDFKYREEDGEGELNEDFDYEDLMEMRESIKKMLLERGAIEAIEE